jgi:poly(A) polymerase
MRESTLKRFIGQDYFDEELELHRADCLASHKNIENYHFCRNILKKLTKKDLRPVPKIKGKDLIGLGLTPGPEFKKILEFAYNEQLEKEKVTKKDLKKRIIEIFINNKSIDI